MHFTTYFPALTAVTAVSALAVPAYQQVDTKFFTTSFDETSLGAVYCAFTSLLSLLFNCSRHPQSRPTNLRGTTSFLPALELMASW
jgi:hypothetical protein